MMKGSIQEYVGRWDALMVTVSTTVQLILETSYGLRVTMSDSSRVFISFS